MAEPDPQVQALLEQLDEENVPPFQALSTSHARALIREFFVRENQEEVLPDSVTRDTIAIEGPGSELPVRVYRPSGEGPFPVLVYFHGGGWVVGGLDEYDDVCAKLAAGAERVVVSVDYRLAPEHPFPAAVEDCYAATQWVTENAGFLNVDTDRLAVGGDSAGGNLTAAVTLMARDQGGPDLERQVLIYPAANPPELQQFESYEENAEGYFLEYAAMEWFYERYIQRQAHLRNEYAFPLLARDLAGLPPATVLTAGFDPLRDEGIEYAERLAEADVAVAHEHYEEMIHGFVSLSEELDAGQAAIDSIADQLSPE